MSFCVSVINLTWNKQYVFFILVNSNFYGIPLPDHVYTRKLKKWIKSFHFWKQNRCRTAQRSHSKNGGRQNKKHTENEITTMVSYRNQNLCFYCKRFNHRQKECRTRIQDKQPCMDNRWWKYWPKLYIDKETAKRHLNGETTQGPLWPISAITNYVTPLMGSWSVVTQIILNLCLALLTTCNKIYDIFAAGEKIRPRVSVRTGSQTTSWLFDTGAAITCMNSRSFNAAFGKQKPKKIANA